jgi:general secretion pathway protein G
VTIPAKQHSIIYGVALGPTLLTAGGAGGGAPAGPQAGGASKAGEAATPAPRSRRPRPRGRGFTFIELAITVAIIGVLALVALPFVELTVKRAKEQELRVGLRQIRAALDEYKKAVDEGHVPKKADESGYPPTLDVLVEGVLDAEDPNKRRRLYFLRRLPRDPFFADPAARPSDTWGKRSYESSHESPAAGRDVFDVYSVAEGTGLNGVPYRQW